MHFLLHYVHLFLVILLYGLKLLLKFKTDPCMIVYSFINLWYSRDMSLDFLEEHCMRENAKDQANGEESTHAFDFHYLPIDFRYTTK